MKWVIKKPELKPLLLKETGFHNTAYLTEIKKVTKMKIAVESQIAKELQEVGNKLDIEKDSNKKMKSELETLNQLVTDLTDEYTKTHNSLEEMEAKLKDVSIN